MMKLGFRYLQLKNRRNCCDGLVAEVRVTDETDGEDGIHRGYELMESQIEDVVCQLK